MSEDPGGAAQSPNLFGEWLDGMARAFGYARDADLARKLGLPQSTVSRWRRGARPSVEHLNRVALLFRTDLTVLLKVTGHIPADYDLELEILPEPPEVTTETVRRIVDANMPGDMKDVLNLYWERRLKEERARIYSLIDEFSASSINRTPNPREWLPTAFETALPKHVLDAFLGLVELSLKYQVGRFAQADSAKTNENVEHGEES